MLGDLESSLDVAPGLPDDAIEVGRIVGAWGIKGWIKVQPFSKDPQALLATTSWFLRSSAERLVESHSVLKVLEARRHGDFVVAHVVDVVDRNGAEALVGGCVMVPRSGFPVASPGEYYWVDLIGMTAVNRQGQLLGVVTGLIDAGPHCVLQLRSMESVERLVPFVAAYVDDVIPAERLIRVDWGLDY